MPVAYSHGTAMIMKMKDIRPSPIRRRIRLGDGTLASRLIPCFH